MSHQKQKKKQTNQNQNQNKHTDTWNPPGESKFQIQRHQYQLKAVSGKSLSSHLLPIFLNHDETKKHQN